MGRIALELADNVVVTSDNPRTEDPELIIDEIETALKEIPAGKTSVRLSDRREAINYDIAQAGADDVVLIAGKGHENYQEIKGIKHHFDDKEVLKDIFANE